jgi:ornithine cyclodeaminase/alanine dehydrogenase-like protein (mu-crystallin family)
MGEDNSIVCLGGTDVDELLAPATCIAAVEEAFRAQGDDRCPPRSSVLGMHVQDGGFHLKAAVSPGWKYFAAKVNANFPGNPDRGLPTIQGVLLLFDGISGSPLAIIDSIRITALRTAAASAVAARFLARPDTQCLFIAGCGTQALAHVDAIRAVRPIKRVLVYDVKPERASALVPIIEGRGLRADIASSLAEARECGAVVTCTPSRVPFLACEHTAPGTFIAAVGADNEHKQEIAPELMRRARVVADSRDQCLAMGDTRGAVAAGAMSPEDIHADLTEIVCQRRPGRSSDDDLFVFDSTGVALEDVAAASAVYQRALATGRGTPVTLASGPASFNPPTVFERYRFVR